MEMAEENLRKLQTLIDEGRYLEKKKESKVTLGELRDQYIAWCKGERQKTLDDKEDHLAAIVEYFGTDTSVTKIARAGVEEYKTSLGTLNAYRKATPLKPASINRRMATLKHLFSKAVEWDMAADNPDRGIKPLKEKNRRLRFLSVAECQALLNACKTPTLKQIVALALNTGMRRGELLSLRWQSISLRNSYIEITEQKNGETSIVPLNTAAVEILSKIPRRLDSEYVFPGRNPGQPYYDLKRQLKQP